VIIAESKKAPADKPKQGAVMLKSLAAIGLAATIAAVITVFSAPAGDVVASPLPQPAADAITACKQRPWPYLNCVGTEFGNPHVRLIVTDRVGQD
jgi:hypothetical protein